ncbi:hypothetical protein [Hydrogenophaga sp.]|uniref:hypothetical protein n=1 Tax=Hydrogenophaga sp. TaxID=1904254 RepID=UPI00262187D0|nr:hypothetical protein [Hydrogenophaga sp.]MDM7951449.1 hypothetical protein [Hydrogenophaga sp.]
MADQDGPRKTALAIIAAYPDTDRHLLLYWAQQVLAVRTLPISVSRKLLRIARITKELGISKSLVTHVAAEIKRVGWTERSKPMRGVIGGAGIGLLASVASPMAGVAAFGGAIAVPVILLGAGAGAVLMALVDELDKKE